jgi:hypothetical protein
MQQVLHYSALRAGLSYLPLAFAIVLSAGVASVAVTRFGFKPVLLSGLLFVAGGLFWFSRVHAPGGSFAGDVLGPSLLAGIGLGLSFVPVTIAAVMGTRARMRPGSPQGSSTRRSRSAAHSGSRSWPRSPTAARKA